jgi:hypothetical protein
VLLTEFITTEVALQASPVLLREAIEAELQKYGDPLRWAVTKVTVADQKAIVEAIVTRKSEG